jgi:predicted TIM-barrel fold metal-dependent hydrolase
LPTVDVHAHYFPPAVVEAFDRLGSQPVWPPHPEGLDERVADLAAAGVDRQLIGLGHNQPYFPDGAAAAECAAFCNDLYAESVANGEGRLGAFAALPMSDVEAATAEARRCLDELDFAGIGLGTSVGNEGNLDDAEFEPLWAELNSRSAVVFLHPVGTPPTRALGTEAYMMGPKFGGPHEMTVAATRLLMSGVTTRHPDIRFVLAAGGGTLAYLWPRFTEMTRALGQLDDVAAYGGDLDSAPADFWFDTAHSDDPRPQRYLIETVGVDRLVLGTDGPRVKPADWIAKIRAGLAADEVELVLGRTAADDLGLIS